MTVAPISALDLVRIEIATEQHAATYGTGPIRVSADDAARYTAEGHLGNLCSHYGLGPVWEAVAEVIGRRPELLTATKVQRQHLAEARAQLCKAAYERATVAVGSKDYAAVLAALDEGEQINPDHRPRDAYTWDDLRRSVKFLALLTTEGDKRH